MDCPFSGQLEWEASWEALENMSPDTHRLSDKSPFFFLSRWLSVLLIVFAAFEIPD